MKTIYKYQIEVADMTSLLLPNGAKALKIAEQNGKLYLWALVDPKQPETEYIHFRIFGTGHDISTVELHEHEYLDTVQVGNFVWHIFWEK